MARSKRRNRAMIHGIVPRFRIRVDDVRRALERNHYPRVQMMVIVLLTGVAGFAASAIMLHLGLGIMAARYFLAVCVAYMVFMLILWIWLRAGADGLDVPDLSGFEPGNDTALPAMRGEGGSFDGGGASGDWDVSGSLKDAASDFSSPSSSSSSSSSLGDLADADEAAIPLFVVALIGGVLVCAFVVVNAAPVLFAELLVDGVLSASLYRRLRGLDRRHWLESAVRRTFWPFVFSVISVTAIGGLMSMYTPGAQSFGEALRGVAEVPAK